MNCNSIEDLRKKIPIIKKDIYDKKVFKELYKFVFDFSRDQGYKNVSIETAIALWELLLH